MKSIKIDIDANPFTAKTNVELEFYNPGDSAVEALYRFTLEPGQIITSLKLELNGTFRDASIEERNKARRAYSTIVGKRIDPALLQKDYGEHYRLNVYPVPSRGTRKVQFTIQQKMLPSSKGMKYSLPLLLDGIAKTSVFIKSDFIDSATFFLPGFFRDSLFHIAGKTAKYSSRIENITSPEGLSFMIPIKEQKSFTLLCPQNNQANFISLLRPNSTPTQHKRIENLIVYWDVSASGKKRNIYDELMFLEKYLTVNQTLKTEIRLFNHALQETIFYKKGEDYSLIRKFLIDYNYTGATSFGKLQLNKPDADAILVFSDGVNSYGNDIPEISGTRINWVLDESLYVSNSIKSIVGFTGGRVFYLNNVNTQPDTYFKDSSINYLLLPQQDEVKFNHSEFVPLTSFHLISGVVSSNGEIEVYMGNELHKFDSVKLRSDYTCKNDSELFQTWKLVSEYENMNNRKGKDLTIFGMENKVVTYSTSFIVLERIEDYIKYNIEPPPDLVQACAERNYVYNNSWLLHLKERQLQENLSYGINEYNKQIQWWNSTSSLRQDSLDGKIMAGEKVPAVFTASALKIPDNSSSVSEVVVTSAFSNVNRRQNSSSIIIRENDLFSRQDNISSALTGRVAGIEVRSNSAVALGREPVVRLRGENSYEKDKGPLYVVNGTIINSAHDIDPDDIDYINVLQAPAAAALFGPEGRNGAILITIRKARKPYPANSVWQSYKLKDLIDEDYLTEIKSVEIGHAWETYLELEKSYEEDASFFFQMADYFFSIHMIDNGWKILYTALDVGGGSKMNTLAAAYILEKNKLFNGAISIYKTLLYNSPSDLSIKRDLALCYLQEGNYIKAIEEYDELIHTAAQDYFDKLKGVAISEMNAAIVMLGNKPIPSFVNRELIKPLPQDLVITLTTNNYSYNNFKVKEPGGEIAVKESNITKSGAKIFEQYSRNEARNASSYHLRKAIPGTYTVSLSLYNWFYSSSSSANYVRMITFKNMNTSSLIIENNLILVSSLWGEFEVSEVKW